MWQQHVLVIEDDAALRRAVVDALRFQGYGTWEADDGERGLEMAVKVECDLILLDLVLPGLDGLDILRQVRASRPALPVIILTARGEESERVRCALPRRTVAGGRRGRVLFSPAGASGRSPGR